MKKKHKSKTLSPGAEIEYINKQLGVDTFLLPPKYWLNSGNKYFNKVAGSKKLGLAYGKIYLVVGPPSSGKSVLAAWLEGKAQEDGADCAWVDKENSFDAAHVSRQGLDPGEPIYAADGKTIVGYENVALFRSLYGKFKTKLKDKKGRLRSVLEERSETAEELLERVEVWMKLRRKQNPKGKLCVVVDSVTSLIPKEEYIAGLSEQNMRTRSSPAVLINAVTKLWTDVAAHTNAMIILIGQLRVNPSKMFGDPHYVTGGEGQGYYASSTMWMRRAEKGGAVIKNGTQVGIKGVISNKKNKVGGGSVEFKRCGYKMLFRKNAWWFGSVDEVKTKV